MEAWGRPNSGSAAVGAPAPVLPKLCAPRLEKNIGRNVRMASYTVRPRAEASARSSLVMTSGSWRAAGVAAADPVVAVDVPLVAHAAAVMSRQNKTIRAG